MRYTDITNGMMFNLLDCHDTHRFFSQVGCNEKTLESALIALAFLPGSINLYYGTEILTQGGYDPDSRRTFDFEKLQEEKIKKVIHKITEILNLKKQPAIAHGDIKIYANLDGLFIERSCDNQRLTLKLNHKNYTIEGDLL